MANEKPKEEYKLDAEETFDLPFEQIETAITIFKLFKELKEVLKRV